MSAPESNWEVPTPSIAQNPRTLQWKTLKRRVQLYPHHLSPIPALFSTKRDPFGHDFSHGTRREQPLSPLTQNTEEISTATCLGTAKQKEEGRRLTATSARVLTTGGTLQNTHSSQICKGHLPGWVMCWITKQGLTNLKIITMTSSFSNHSGWKEEINNIGKMLYGN